MSILPFKFNETIGQEKKKARISRSIIYMKLIRIKKEGKKNTLFHSIIIKLLSSRRIVLTQIIRTI